MLTTKVLVLNNSFMPLYITTVKTAISLLFREKAEVVSVEEDLYNTYNLSSWEEVSYLRSELEKDFKYLRGGEDYVLGAPKVIRLTKHSKIPHRVKLTRANIFLRDDNTCQYCDKKKSSTELNIDHIIPKSQGGKNTWENLACSCIRCNESKGSRTPKQAGMSLVKKPKRPSSFLMFKNYLKRIDEDPFKDWKYFFPEDFISEIYWNVELKE